MTKKRIAIFGVGAIGGCLGGYLTKAGVDVTLIDQWPENIEAIKANGLRVKSMEEEFTVKPKTALHLTEVSGTRQQWDIVFLSVKSQDTVWATRFIEPHLAPGGYVVSAQNGINDDTIAGLLGWSRVVGCVVSFGAGMYEPGRPEYTSPSSRLALIFGESSGLITQRVSELAEIVGRARSVKTTTNLWGERWGKLGTNCMANALSGITGLKSAEMRMNERARRASIRIAAELVQVATALGVEVAPISGVEAGLFVKSLSDGGVLEEVEGKLIEFGKGIGIGRPSLAQDLLKGRRTEVDHLNGYVVKRGQDVGIATPVNEAVVKLCLQVESGEVKP
ncbi:MAG: 2-dehydropantoate 2-reductase, partial [Chloroflexi bacterium]|nr:2-dehydropantoate 2-reductase [Chloroflexota bacterium]